MRRSPSSAGRRLLSLLPVTLAFLVMASPARADELGQVGFALDGTDLLSFDLRTPGTTTTVAVSGVASGEELVALAVRPQSGMLYALGHNATAKTVQLYTLSERTGLATPVGSSGSFVDASSNPVELTGTRWGLAFNPAFDRVRVVSSSGLNFRMDPNSGALTDGDLGVSGVNPDTALNGAATTADATAYVAPVPNTTRTTQYTASSATDVLAVQQPPNSGALTVPVSLKLGGAALDVDAIAGLAFLPGVAPASSGDPVTTTVYSVLRYGGTTRVAAIDTATGAVSPIGVLGSGAASIRGFAVRSEERPGGIPAIALSAFKELIRFNTALPGTSTTVGITNTNASDALVGIVRRPANGVYYVLGVSAATDIATLYRVDPQSGGSTVIGSAGTITFVDASGTTVDLPPSGYGMAVNPSTDRIRVVASNGLTFRINPNTGAPIDGNAGANGVNPDGSVTGLPGGATGLIGVASTNGFAGATATTLYTLEPSSNSLFIQNPPNAGVLSSQRSIAGLDITSPSGFDVPANVLASANGAAATSGNAYVVTGANGSSTLNAVDLTTGASSSLGTVGPLAAGLSLGVPAPSFVAIAGAPTPTPTPTTPVPGGGTPPANVTLRSVTAASKRFRVGKRPKGAPRAPTGATLTVDLDVDATLQVAIEREVRGRTAKGRCVAATTRNRRLPACTLTRSAGKVTLAARAGRTTVTFSGRIGGRALAPGRYRLRVVATAPGRGASAERTVRLTVIR